LPGPRKINWVYDQEVSQKIEKASKDYFSYFEDHDYALLHYNKYGADWVKEVAKMSPDSWAQMAIQLAYYKIHGRGRKFQGKFSNLCV
jgi:carnitine O-acetyltransferase